MIEQNRVELKMTDETGKSGDKETRILRAVKMTLTNVIKDTATKPGMRHPLSEQTVMDLRNCLVLISERERELVELSGGSMDMRPRFIDEPRKNDKVTVSIDSLKKNK